MTQSNHRRVGENKLKLTNGKFWGMNGTVGQLDSWTVGQLGSWTVGQLDKLKNIFS